MQFFNLTAIWLVSNFLF